MNVMLPMNKSVDGGAGGHENGGSGSMAASAPSAVPFIRTAGSHKVTTAVGHDRGHIQVAPLQIPASSSVNMQGCSPVAIQHPNIAARHQQQQQSNFAPIPKTAASGGALHTSFYLYDDQATTYQCLGVSPPNLNPGINHVQNLGGQHQHGGMPMSYSQHSTSVCGVPSVVRIPQRNTAQNRSSVTNTMQYFPVNMQPESVVPPPQPPPGMFQPHPQSSPSQLVVSGGHSTGAPYLPPPTGGAHSPNWPPNPSERVTFQNESLTNQPPQISTEQPHQQQQNLLIKSENSEDQSSCYRQQRSVPCLSQQQHIKRDDVIKDDATGMSRRQPPGGVVPATTSQLLSSSSSSSLYPSHRDALSNMSSTGQQQMNSSRQSDSVSTTSSSVESSSSTAGGFGGAQGTCSVGSGVPPATPPQSSSTTSQQNAQSSKSSPSPVEFSPEQMDLATLPAFNFNLDEICEDVLFPEKDDFDDIFIDDLTIAPSPSCPPGTSGSGDTTLHNLDQRDRPCGSKDGILKLEPGTVSCSKTSPSGGGSLEDDIFNRPSASIPSNFGGPGFLDDVKEEDGGKDGDVLCRGRLEGAFGGASSSHSPTNYADLPNRGANDTFENMDYKSSDGSTTASVAADGSPSHLATSGKGKQQVSPSPSYASCLGAAGVGNVRRRRRPGVDRPSSSGEACTICGDKASGYHYNALSCEGCKGFFRRSVTNDRKYTCERNGECNIDIYMRRKCQKCRLDRCYAAGMRKECLMSVEQCRSMQAKRKSRSGPSGTGPVTSSGGTIVLGGVATGAPMQNNPAAIMQVAAPAGMGGAQAVNNVNALSANAITSNLGANMPPPPPHPHATMVGSNSQQPSLQHPYPPSVGTSLPHLHSVHNTSRVAHQITTTHITSMSNDNNNHAVAVGVMDPKVTPTPNYSGMSMMPVGPPPALDSSRSSHGMNGDADSSDTQAMTSSMQQLLISIPPQYDSEKELRDVGLSPDQVDLVRNLIMDRWSVGMPNSDKIRYLPPWPGRTGDVKLTSLSRDQQRQMKFQHMTHLTRMCMEGVIGLAKKLRDFSNLSQQDQIRIVKPACLEILMINSAQYFDVTTDRLLMATGHWTSHEQMEDGLLKYGFGTQMWQYVRTLAQMRLHDIEFTLLTALCVYSPDRPGLTNEGRVQVSQFQQPYRTCLDIYCRYMYPQSAPGTPDRMSQLLSKLYELRSVSFQHSKYIYGIQLNKSNWEPLPQLLGEIFDQGSEVCSEEETSPPLNNNSSSSSNSVQQQGETRVPVIQQVPHSTGPANTCHAGVMPQQSPPLSSCSPVSSSSCSNNNPTVASPAHSTAAVSTGAKQYAIGHAPSVVNMVAPPSSTQPHPPVSVATPLGNTPPNIRGGAPN